MVSRRAIWCQVLGLLLLVVMGFRMAPSATVCGTVVDDDGPVSGATVRVQATTNATVTDGEGRFTLAGLEHGEPVTVSAWSQGYYCAVARGVVPPASRVTLTLRAYQTNDNPNYVWIPPTGQTHAPAANRS